MTALGFIGALAGLISLAWAFVERTNRRVALYFIMYVMHLSACVIYYVYAQTHDADTKMYYADPYHFFGVMSGTGTWFVINLVQTMKLWIGGTYLDYFLLFQALGFWGLALLARTIEEITFELRVPQSQMLYLALFLPGIYYWTSAIGKDAPLFLGTSLAAWSIIQIQRRFYWFGAAVVLMFPFRPHIALIALIALAGALGLDRRNNLWLRITLIAVVVMGGGVVAATLRDSMSVDVSDLSSVADFLATHSDDSSSDGASLANASFPVKLFSQLFRPFFIDANGALGIVASFESLFLMIIFLKLIWEWRLVVELTRKIAFFRYSMIFSIVLTSFLSAIFYNVGLGLRQKMMIMPSLLAMYAVVMGVSLVRRSGRTDAGHGAAAQPTHALLPSQR